MPLPEPEEPPVTVIQAALLAAVQAHPAPAVTATLPLLSVLGNDWLVGEIE